VTSAVQITQRKKMPGSSFSFISCNMYMVLLINKNNQNVTLKTNENEATVD